MKKLIPKSKIWLVMALCLLCALPYSEAFAWGTSKGSRSRQEVVVVKQHKYHYRDGRFYRPGWFGFSLAVVIPPMGAVVTYIPAGHRRVIVGGITYFYYDNIYYKACPSGYIVVQEPVIKEKPGETVSINIPNSNGSFTVVTLVKQKDGYIGPQGEYYPGRPTVEQLKVLYGN